MDVQITNYRCADGFGDFTDSKKLFEIEKKIVIARYEANPNCADRIFKATL
jgi:hypothetical protein